jgi:hypothetical protein
LHTAIPALEIACTHSRYVYKPFTPRHSVLTGFIELVQLLFHFRPFWPWPSQYLNHMAMQLLQVAYTHSRYVYELFTPRCFVLIGFIELIQLLFHFRPPRLLVRHVN